MVIDMFVVNGDKVEVDSQSPVFDFHFPGNPIVPGALTAALMHHDYCRKNSEMIRDVDILFKKPISKQDVLTLYADKNKFCLLGKDNCERVVMHLCNSNDKPTRKNLILTSKKRSSLVHRSKELKFHDHCFIGDKVASCTINLDSIIKNRPYLHNQFGSKYFVVLETMANLAVELNAFENSETCLLYSIKGLWFDWTKTYGKLNVVTFSHRINNKILGWSSQLLNEKNNIVGYVKNGLSVTAPKK